MTRKMRKRFRLALVSMKHVLKDPRAPVEERIADVEANVERHRSWLETAAEAEPDFAGFPEFSLTGWIGAPHAALTLRSAAVREIGRQARRCGVPVGTCFVQKRGSRLYNTCVLFDARGRLVGTTCKVNLVGAEQKHYTSSRSWPVHEVAGVRLGVAICADSSYYETHRLLSFAGAEIVFAPHGNTLGRYGNCRAGWVRWRRETWPLFARDARVCIAGVSCAGLSSPGEPQEVATAYCGGGAVVDWQGRFVATLGGRTKREGMLVADIDIAALRRARSENWWGVFRPGLVYNRKGFLCGEAVGARGERTTA